MKIACLSDTHGYHSEFTIPECDMFIFAGDYSYDGSSFDFFGFMKWMAQVPAQRKIMVPGNHDFFVQRQGPMCVDHAQSLGIELLIGESSADGLVFGWPYCPQFGSWAFMRTHEEMNALFDLTLEAAQQCQILVTHSPARGTLDKTHRGDCAGCGTLERYLGGDMRPKLHVHGHIHEAHGMKRKNGVVSVNCACQVVTLDLRISTKIR